MVHKDSTPIDAYRQYHFHSITTHLLLTSKRSHLGLETAVLFLCTRIKYPVEEDWIKIRRVINFMKGTKDDPRIMLSDEFLQLNKLVDTYPWYTTTGGDTLVELCSLDEYWYTNNI